MTDIVDRLHIHADIFEGEEGDLMRESAAEIERLRAAIAAEREANISIVFGLCVSDNNAQEIAAAIRARRP